MEDRGSTKMLMMTMAIIMIVVIMMTIVVLMLMMKVRRAACSFCSCDSGIARTHSTRSLSA